jgi:exodeoxyribonuclease VII large subunit
MQADWTLSVSQLNEYARRLLAGDPLLRSLRVRGEVTGFKRHYSGHLYFTIKDEAARVQCVMFRQNALSLDFELSDGQMVVIEGSASLYAATGAYQIYCQAIRREGAGALYLKFEALKKKLSDEGLFDASLKKPLPLLPRRVGIVTSPTGAAIRDMIRILRRRNPAVDILIAPCQVQGEGAAEDIARALGALNRRGSVDVILCGRGGGSIEDLWAFNEEAVARAIARSKIPVISCVGHETDFTIADFVADARAATPSMAAEMASPVRQELLEALSRQKLRMDRALGGRLTLQRERLKRLELAFRWPEAILIRPRREALKGLEARMAVVLERRTGAAGNRLQVLSRALSGLNPEGVLSRGYALVESNGKILTSVQGVEPGREVAITLSGGALDAVVSRVRRGETNHGT